MTKIKKWQFIILLMTFFLFLKGFVWINEHPWLFENDIKPENYQAFLNNTTWKWEAMGRKWIFKSDGTYTEYLLLDAKEERLIYKGQWSVNRNELRIKGTRYSENGGRNGDSKKIIDVLTENYLNTSTISPSYGAGVGKYYIPEELKKIKHD